MWADMQIKNVGDNSEYCYVLTEPQIDILLG